MSSSSETQSNPDALVTSSDPKHVSPEPSRILHSELLTDSSQPANLIPELCRAFYHLGWVTGTGGGICIREGYE